MIISFSSNLSVKKALGSGMMFEEAGVTGTEGLIIGKFYDFMSFTPSYKWKTLSLTSKYSPSGVMENPISAYMSSKTHKRGYWTRAIRKTINRNTIKVIGRRAFDQKG